ncbi:MAG: spike base protein, RCAP_Rcc01079 family [Gammaproteobacteria bacterium]
MKREGGFVVKKSAALTASANDISPRPDAILVGGAGTLIVTWEDGSTDTLNGLLAGNIYPISPRRVTGGTATLLSALYFDVTTPPTT